MDWLSVTTPLIIGHRGASAYAPENTLAAFQLAADQKADGIEFDVQLTADHRLIIIHDSTVDRTTDGSGVVSQMSLAELQELDAGNGQTLPTLDSVFETFGPRFLYNIEIKEFNLREKGTEAAVADCIQSHQLNSQILVSSFSPWAVRRARRYLTRSVPVGLIRWRGWLKYTYFLARGEADHPHFSLVNEKYVKWAEKREQRVHVWTVDDPGEALRLAGLGVHGIITNKPDLIRQSMGGG